MDAHTDTANPNGTLPPLKAVALGFAAMQVGPCLASVPTLLQQFGGPGSWISALLTLSVALLIAWSIATFARRYVVSGSLVSYAEIAFGEAGQHLVGVALMLGYLGVIAMIVNDEIYYLTSFLVETGFTSAPHFLWQCGLAVAAATVSAYFAYRGPDLSAKVAGVLALISLPVIVTVMTIAFSKNSAGFFDQFDTRRYDVHGIIAGAIWGMAIYVGFDGLTSVASDTQNPRKNVPAILLSILVLCGVTWSLGSLFQYPVLAPHMKEIIGGRTAISVIASQAGLSHYTTAFDIIVGASVIASTIAFFNFAARIVATAARDGMLPRGLGHIDPESHAPRPAIVLVGIIGALVPILVRVSGAVNPIGAITTLAGIVLYFWLIPYFLICVGAIVILRREGRGRLLSVLWSGMGAMALLSIVGQSVFRSADGWVKPAIATAILMVALVLIHFCGRHVRSPDAALAASSE